MAEEVPLEEEVPLGGARKSADGHNHRLCPNGEYDIPSSFRSSLLVLGDDDISLCFFLSRSKEGRFRGRFPGLTSNLCFDFFPFRVAFR